MCAQARIADKLGDPFEAAEELAPTTIEPMLIEVTIGQAAGGKDVPPGAGSAVGVGSVRSAPTALGGGLRRRHGTAAPGQLLVVSLT